MSHPGVSHYAVLDVESNERFLVEVGEGTEDIVSGVLKYSN